MAGPTCVLVRLSNWRSRANMRSKANRQANQQANRSQMTHNKISLLKETFGRHATCFMCSCERGTRHFPCDIPRLSCFLWTTGRSGLLRQNNTSTSVLKQPKVTQHPSNEEVVLPHTSHKPTRPELRWQLLLLTCLTKTVFMRPMMSHKAPRKRNPPWARTQSPGAGGPRLCPGHPR